MNPNQSYSIFDEMAQERRMAEHATSGQRLANYVIDIFAAVIFLFILALLSSLFGMAGFFSSIISVVIMFWLPLYYFVFESATKGRTLGKLITGTIAVKEDTLPITSKDALIRSLIRMIPFEPVSMLMNGPWHDTWSRTIVIKKSRGDSNTLAP